MLCLIWALIPFLSAFTQKESICNQIINRNARYSVSVYSITNTRSYFNYQNILGDRFKKLIQEIPHASQLDSGGGFGLAGLERVLSDKKTQVTIINAQDNWSLFLDPQAEKNPYFNSPERKLMVLKLMNYLDLKTRDLTEENWKHLAILRLKAVYQKAIQSKRFHYEVGFAENIIPNLNKNFDLITDVYGAYYYSAGRVALLDQYYQKLSDQGSALIVTKAIEKQKTQGPENKIKGSTLTLENYLVQTYPEIFEIIETENSGIKNKILTMKKNSRISKLNLNEKIKLSRYWFNENTNSIMSEVPCVEWEILQP